MAHPSYGIGKEIVIYADNANREDVTYTIHPEFLRWCASRGYIPCRHPEIHPALLVDAQVYALTDGMQ